MDDPEEKLRFQLAQLIFWTIFMVGAVGIIIFIDEVLIPFFDDLIKVFTGAE